MIFRRAQPQHTASDLDAQDRRSGRGPDPDDRPGGSTPQHAAGDHEAARNDSGRLRLEAAADLPADERGPYDADEVDLTDPSAQGWVDLGGIVIRPGEGMELRVQLDEETQAVIAPVLVLDESGMEMRGFAAPRSGGLWEELRHELAGEATQRGGLSEEATGPFGPELKVTVPVRTPQGENVTQTSRIVGVEGPRWFLRATLLGEAATDDRAAAPFLEALRDVVVVRGKDAMAPRELLTLLLPDVVQEQIGEDAPDSRGAG